MHPGALTKPLFQPPALRLPPLLHPSSTPAKDLVSVFLIFIIYPKVNAVNDIAYYNKGTSAVSSSRSQKPAYPLIIPHHSPRRCRRTTRRSRRRRPLRLPRRRRGCKTFRSPYTARRPSEYVTEAEGRKSPFIWCGRGSYFNSHTAARQRAARFNATENRSVQKAKKQKQKADSPTAPFSPSFRFCLTSACSCG